MSRADAETEAPAGARPPSWPLLAWGAQLLPALALIAFGFWYGAGTEAALLQKVSVASIGVGALWTVVTAGALVLPRTRAKIVEHRRDLALMTVTLIVCLVLADLFLGWTGLVRTVEEQRARSISYSFGGLTKHRLVPQVVDRDEVVVEINSRGFRGPEIEAAPAPGTVRIAFLGGSHVFDFKGMGGGWPHRVERMLRERGHAVEVINAGVPGHDAPDSLGKLVGDVWTLAPDIVFVCHGWNDAKYFTRVSAENPYRGLPPDAPKAWAVDWRIYPSGIDRVLSRSSIYRLFRWRVSRRLYDAEGQRRRSVHESVPESWGDSPGLQQFALAMHLVAEAGAFIGADVALCKQAHKAVREGSGPEQESARAYGRRLIRLEHDDLMAAYDAIDAVVDRVASEQGATVVDMSAELSGRDALYIDGIHYNEEGSEAAARVAAQALEPLVVRRLEAR